MRLKLFVYVVFSVCSTGMLFAQRDSLFTLKECINIALEQNLDIQIAKTDVQVAEINNNFGNAGGLPVLAGTISTSEALSNIDQKLANGTEIIRNNVDNSSFNSTLSFTWRIFNGMRVRATKDRFEALEKIGEIQLSQQIDRIIFDVTNVYYNLVRLNKQIIATEAIINLSSERLKIAETRFNVGSGAKTDMLQASIDLNTQAVNLENIHKQVANNRTLINALLKRNIKEGFGTKDNEFSIPTIQFDEITSKVDQQNQQLLIAQQQKMNLLLERKIIQSQRIPSINLNSNTILNQNKSSAGFFLTNQTFGPNIGLGVGIPIFNGNITKTQLKVNTVQQKQQDLVIQQTKNILLRDLLIAHQEYENAVAVAKVEALNVKLATENNMISTERFRKLQSNSIELRQAQLSLIEAQDRFINAQYRAQIAAAAIYFLVGGISHQ